MAGGGGYKGPPAPPVARSNRPPPQTTSDTIMTLSFFRKKPEPPLPSAVLADILDRIGALERAVRRVEQGAAEDQADLQRRFGKVWAALKALRHDEPDADKADSAPPAQSGLAGTHARLEAFRRRRGLLHG